MQSAALRPAGFTALGIFFFFGAAMALLAGCTLLWPGSALDRAWQLNPDAYKQMAPIGSRVGALFLLLSAVLLLTGIGWLKRRRWGWILAVIIHDYPALRRPDQYLSGRISKSIWANI